MLQTKPSNTVTSLLNYTAIKMHIMNSLHLVKLYLCEFYFFVDLKLLYDLPLDQTSTSHLETSICKTLLQLFIQRQFLFGFL